MDLVLGISGGHTRSQALALREGEIVGSVVGESLNYHAYGPDAINTRATTLLSNLAATLELGSVEQLVRQTNRVTLTLPGVTSKFDLDLAKDCLGNRKWPDPDCVRIVDDTWAGLIAGALDRRGICAIAGTGASVFMGLGDFVLGKSSKLDGYGPVLGDWGSGFRMAAYYLEDVGRHYDNNLQIPLLNELLQAEPKITSADGIQNWFDALCRANPHDWRIYFAKIARVVTEAAERKDAPKYAVELVKRSAGELVDTIRMALGRASAKLRNRDDLSVDSLKVVCHGSQFTESSVFFTHVKNELVKSHPKNEVMLAKFTSVVGATLMAYAEDRIIPEPPDVVRITRGILRHPSGAEHGLLVPHGDVIEVSADATSG